MTPFKGSLVKLQLVKEGGFIFPIFSMYGQFTFIWHEFMVNVGTSSIHGAFGFVYIQTKLFIIYLLMCGYIYLYTDTDTFLSFLF